MDAALRRRSRSRSRRCAGWPAGTGSCGTGGCSGLFAFFYGTLHFLTYIWLDQFFDLASITKDVIKRPFITVGFTAFVLMIPLALTSTTGWIRRLGGKRWQALHRLVYVTAMLGVVHYWWLVKADISRPLAYGAIVATLLATRLVSRLKPKLRHAVPAPHALTRGDPSAGAAACARDALPRVRDVRQARLGRAAVRLRRSSARPRHPTSADRAARPGWMRVQLDDRLPAPHGEQRAARDLPDDVVVRGQRRIGDLVAVGQHRLEVALRQRALVVPDAPERSGRQPREQRVAEAELVDEMPAASERVAGHPDGVPDDRRRMLRTEPREHPLFVLRPVRMRCRVTRAVRGK